MKKRIFAGITALMLLIAFCVSAEEPDPDFSQLDGKRIGVLTGTIWGPMLEEELPEAEVSYFNMVTDMIAALEAGRIDACCHDEPVIRFVALEHPDVEILDGFLAISNLAAIFPKTPEGETLRDRYSAFLDRLWADGTMEEIDRIWFGREEEKRTLPEYENMPGSNGVLRMAVDPSQVPFTYMKDSRMVGYEVDLAVRFCEENGFQLEVVPMSFDGLLAAVQSGKCDFAASCITITEERKESVLFSTPDYYGGCVMAELMGADTESTREVFTSLSQLNGKRIGVQTGTNFAEMVEKKLPDARIETYNTKADLVASLTGQKVDAFVVDEPVARLVAKENSQITWLTEYLDQYHAGFVFAKNETGEALQKKADDFLKNLPEGTLDALADKWFGEDEEAKTMPDPATFSAENGTLRVATESGYAPFEYIRDGKVVGYDMELAAMFCQASGYGMEIVDMNFDGILPSVQSGKVRLRCSRHQYYAGAGRERPVLRADLFRSYGRDGAEGGDSPGEAGKGKFLGEHRRQF